jgi:hypothetical protein
MFPVDLPGNGQIIIYQCYRLIAESGMTNERMIFTQNPAKPQEQKSAMPGPP